MATTTLFVYCGVQGDAADALADRELVEERHTQANPGVHFWVIGHHDEKRSVDLIWREITDRRLSGVAQELGERAPRRGRLGLSVALLPDDGGVDANKDAL
jgi:hypothetical protein